MQEPQCTICYEVVELDDHHRELDCSFKGCTQRVCHEKCICVYLRKNGHGKPEQKTGYRCPATLDNGGPCRGTIRKTHVKTPTNAKKKEQACQTAVIANQFVNASRAPAPTPAVKTVKDKQGPVRAKHANAAPLMPTSVNVIPNRSVAFPASTNKINRTTSAASGRMVQPPMIPGLSDTQAGASGSSRPAATVRANKQADLIRVEKTAPAVARAAANNDTATLAVATGNTAAEGDLGTGWQKACGKKSRVLNCLFDGEASPPLTIKTSSRVHATTLPDGESPAASSFGGESSASSSFGGDSPDTPSLSGDSSDTPSLGGDSSDTPSLGGDSPDTPSLGGDSPDTPSLGGDSLDTPSPDVVSQFLVDTSDEMDPIISYEAAYMFQGGDVVFVMDPYGEYKPMTEVYGPSAALFCRLGQAAGTVEWVVAVRQSCCEYSMAACPSDVAPQVVQQEAIEEEGEEDLEDLLALCLGHVGA